MKGSGRRFAGQWSLLRLAARTPQDVRASAWPGGTPDQRQKRMCKFPRRFGGEDVC